MNYNKHGIIKLLPYIIICFFVFISISLFTDNKPVQAAKYNVEVSGKVRGNGKKQTDVLILIYDKKGELFKEIKSPKGKFYFKLPIDDEYVIFFVKPPFEVKVIDFNTLIEGISLNDVWAFHNLKIDMISKKDTDIKKSLNAIERVDWDMTNVLFEHSFLAMPRKYDSKYKEYIESEQFNKATRIIFRIINEYMNGTSDKMLVIQESGITKEQLEKQAEQNKELVGSLKLKRELIKLDLEATNLKLEFIDDLSIRKQIAKNLADIETLLGILDNEILQAQEDYSDDIKLLKKYDNIDDQLYSIKSDLDKASPGIDSAQLVKNYKDKYYPKKNKANSTPNNTHIETDNNTNDVLEFHYNQDESKNDDQTSNVNVRKSYNNHQKENDVLEFQYNEEKGDQKTEIYNLPPSNIETEEENSAESNLIQSEQLVKEEESILNNLSDEELWKKAEESKRRQEEKIAAQERALELERIKAKEDAERLEAERNSQILKNKTAEEHYANKDDSTTTFINDLLKSKTPIEEYNFTVGKDTIFVKRYKTTKGEFMVLTDSKNKVQLLKNNTLVTEPVFGEKEQQEYKKLDKLSEINIRYDKIGIIKSTSKKGLVFRVQIGSLSKPNTKAFLNLRDLGPLSTELHKNLYKYMVGEYATINELEPIKKRIKLLIPGAFNVAYYYGARIPMRQAYNLIVE